MMEAFRILNALDIQPCRTIRAALWGGHEGRRAGAGYYLRNHYGSPEPETTTKEYENLSIYFNVNWYGRFRGIFMK